MLIFQFCNFDDHLRDKETIVRMHQIKRPRICIFVYTGLISCISIWGSWGQYESSAIGGLRYCKQL